jgi:hypothetical protein
MVQHGVNTQAECRGNVCLLRHQKRSRTLEWPAFVERPAKIWRQTMTKVGVEEDICLQKPNSGGAGTRFIQGDPVLGLLAGT